MIVQLATGLSALWINYRQDSNLFDPPFFSLANYEFNAQNRLLLGARFAVSYNFTPIP
ncbi:hypothetical protein KIH41_06475 [Litoribacter ruber]|uniref:hypothetical protein n=1 Tax=Litoribacter ruber TaxID=702568 RepID=UPI001BD934EA|nr:hypothetical protein [Litoribacter ruber]MBT0810923.1 hypothetical protein [Litoribacter ruber]